MPKQTFDAIKLTPAFVEHNKVGELHVDDYSTIHNQLAKANDYFDLSIDSSVIGAPTDWVKISPESCANQQDRINRLSDLGMLPKELSENDFVSGN